MWHGPTCKKLSFIWGHHHLNLVNDRSISLFLHYLLHRADETQQGRNSCPRLQFLAFSLDSIMWLSRYVSSLSIIGWSDFLQTLRKPVAFSIAVLFIIVFSSVLIKYSVPSKIQQNHHTSRMIDRSCLLQKHILENTANQNIEKPLYTRRYHTQSSHRSLREGRLNFVGHFLSPSLSSIPSRAVFHTALQLTEGL